MICGAAKHKFWVFVENVFVGNTSGKVSAFSMNIKLIFFIIVYGWVDGRYESLFQKPTEKENKSPTSEE